MPEYHGFRPPLAFHTSALTRFRHFQPWSLPKMAGWAVEHGFAGLEIGPWVALDAAAFAAARRQGSTIFALTYGRNVLADDPDERAFHQRNVLDRVHFACEQSIPLVVLATGRMGGRSLRQNLPAVVEWLGEKVLPLAQQGNVTVAIENCPAVGNVATSPAMWDELFTALPADNLALAFDPSHLVWQFIDPYAALRQHVHRVVHIHVKDTEIDQARLAREGIDGDGWWRYCLPGSGMLNWSTLLAIFQASSYRGCLSIELEDAVWEQSEGQILQALLLSQCIIDQLLGPVVEVPPVEAIAPSIPEGITFV